MGRTDTLLKLGKQSGGYPYIELLVGLEKGKVFALSRDHLSIGRSDENDILFASDAVSRIHALLSREEEGWRIRDNRSRNGIQINGLKCDSQILKSGDLVQVGDFAFRFMDPATQRANSRITNAAPPVFQQRQPFIRPVWAIGLVLCGLVYFILTQPKGEKTPAVPTPATIARTAIPVIKPEVANQSVNPAKTALSQARPLTREDIVIKTRKTIKKVESGKSLKIYLDEGKHYLSQGDFESAGIAFNFAILIDPRNATAIRGMQAAESGVRELTSIPPVVVATSPAKSGPNRDDKKLQVSKLFETANSAVFSKKYQKAIDAAESIRRIEIKGETVYLNEAKQIIDQAKLRQKEEFEPFLKQANSMIDEKSFRAARELCDQMLKRDEAYLPAKECRDRADDALGRQARSVGRP